MSELYSYDINGFAYWTDSSLNEYLNGEYLNSISDSYMIKSSSYNLGGIETFNIDSDSIYEAENSYNHISGGIPTIDNTKITIMYPSDYVYSIKTGDGYCNSFANDYYYKNECQAGGTWLYNNEKAEWFLSFLANEVNSAAFITEGGSLELYNDVSFNKFTVRPSLYLTEDVEIYSGEGSSGNPYIIGT